MERAHAARRSILREEITAPESDAPTGAACRRRDRPPVVSAHSSGGARLRRSTPKTLATAARARISRSCRRIIGLGVACAQLVAAEVGVASQSDVQAFLDRAESVFEAPPIELVTIKNRPGHGPWYRSGRIYFPSALYESPFRFEILAHEFGHHLERGRHSHPLFGSPAYRQAWQYRREIAAHVRAIDVLVRVEGISDLDALTRIHRLLVALDAGEILGVSYRPYGHKNRCIEAADLLKLFPQYQDGSWKCPRRAEE